MHLNARIPENLTIWTVSYALICFKFRAGPDLFQVQGRPRPVSSSGLALTCCMCRDTVFLIKVLPGRGQDLERDARHQQPPARGRRLADGAVLRLAGGRADRPDALGVLWPVHLLLHPNKLAHPDFW